MTLPSCLSRRVSRRSDRRARRAEQAPLEPSWIGLKNRHSVRAAAAGTRGASCGLIMTNSAAAAFHVDTILTLPEQTGAHAIAAARREAALSFLNDSDRWGKAELAMWLMGPYAQLTTYGSAYARSKRGEI